MSIYTRHTADLRGLAVEALAEHVLRIAEERRGALGDFGNFDDRREFIEQVAGEVVDAALDWAAHKQELRRRVVGP